MTNVWNRKNIIGSTLAFIGFLLSPLSWWNDIIINIPLAYGFAVLCSYFIPNYFSMFLILGYWLTNVLGLVLMHKGGALVLDQGENRYTVKSVITDLKTSFVYSILIAVLVIFKVLKLPGEYF